MNGTKRDRLRGSRHEVLCKADGGHSGLESELLLTKVPQRCPLSARNERDEKGQAPWASARGTLQRGHSGLESELLLTKLPQLCPLSARNERDKKRQAPWVSARGTLQRGWGTQRARVRTPSHKTTAAGVP